MTWLNAPSGKKEDRLPVRAAEHNAILPRGDGTEEVSETCTVITTLLDHEAAPADAVRDTYLTRWSASETTFGEDKATIAGAGNRTSGPVLRSGSPRLVIQEAWAWLTATQLVRASAAAALRSEAAAARALRRKDAALVTADEESFTAVRRHAIRSMTSIPGHGLIVAGSDRRRSRRRRPRRPAHPERPRTAAALQSARRKPARNSRTPPRPRRPSPGNPRSPYSRPASHSPPPGPEPSGRRNRPARRGRGPWNRAPSPPRHAGPGHARTPAHHHGNRLQEHAQNTKTHQHPRKTETPKVRWCWATAWPGTAQRRLKDRTAAEAAPGPEPPVARRSAGVSLAVHAGVYEHLPPVSRAGAGDLGVEGEFAGRDQTGTEAAWRWSPGSAPWWP